MRVAKVSKEKKIALFFSEAANIAKTEKKLIENGFTTCRNLFQAVILLCASKISRFQMRVAKVNQQEKKALSFSEAANIAKTEKKIHN